MKASACSAIRCAEIVSLALVIALSGCSPMVKKSGSQTPDSPAQERMDQLSAAYRRTVLQGALIGAASGAAIGAVAASKNRGQGALIGAGAGLLAGLIAGAIVGEQQKQYAGTENELNEVIASSRQSNDILDQLVKDMEAVVAEDNKHIAEVDVQLQQGQIDEAEAERRLARVNADRDQMQETLGTARKRKAELERASAAAAAAKSNGASAATRKELDDEIQRMDKLIERAQATYDGLKPSPVG